MTAAVITGAAGDLGRALSEAFLADGYRVYGGDIAPVEPRAGSGARSSRRHRARRDLRAGRARRGRGRPPEALDQRRRHPARGQGRGGGSRGLGADHRGQPHRHLPRLRRGARGDEPERRRAHRQHRLAVRPGRRHRAASGLRRLQGGRARADQDLRPRRRQARRLLQRRGAVGDRGGDGRPAERAPARAARARQSACAALPACPRWSTRCAISRATPRATPTA